MSLLGRLTRLVRTELRGYLGRTSSSQTGSKRHHVDDIFNDTNADDANFHDATFHDGTSDDGSRNQKQPSSTYDPQLARYYSALELPYGSDLQAVKQAHRQLMKRYHPDLYQGDPVKQETAGEITRQLNDAYQELSKHLQAT